MVSKILRSLRGLADATTDLLKVFAKHKQGCSPQKLLATCKFVCIEQSVQSHAILHACHAIHFQVHFLLLRSLHHRHATTLC